MQSFLSYLNEFLFFRNFIEVISGLDNTLLLLIISLPIGFILSLIFALGRVSKNKFISKPIASYIFVIRGTPLLVQIYLIYFGLEMLKICLEKSPFQNKLI
jgi:His/Glu/Gln/Arg/opine family amino acid ABC transporter permease subunit